MPRKFVEFGEWLPDLQDFGKPGLRRCFGVFPLAHSYRPFNRQETFSTNTLLNRCQGAIIATDKDNAAYNIAGDSSALYAMVSSTFVDVTRAALSGGPYSMLAAASWDFAQFGDLLVACNGVSGSTLQAISLSAAAIFGNLTGADFLRAETVAVVRDFIIAGNVYQTTSASGVFAQRVRWCASNNPTSWTPDAATMADFQDVVGPGGSVMKIIGGEYGVILQRRAIYRMDFVGSPLIFQFDNVQQNLGLVAKNAAVAYQNLVFFLSDDGFYAFDGAQVTPIGRGKVDNAFWQGALPETEVNKAFLNRIVAEVDPENKLVMWAYPNTTSTGGTANAMLVYNWAYNRWSALNGIAIEYLTRHISAGAATVLAVYNNVHGLSRFTGPQESATFTMAELNLNPGGVATVVEARPYIETSGTAVAAVVHAFRRNRLDNAFTAVALVTVDSKMVANMRATGRYHAMRLGIPAASTSGTLAYKVWHITGMELEFQKDGWR